MTAIQADFFNNACTVIPLLLLTKVAERARRRQRDEDRGEAMHVSFIGVGFAAEGIALWGSRTPNNTTGVILIVAMALCLVLFVAELLHTGGSKFEA
jgi:hypothetical protein